MKTVHLKISGKVQGVFFRASAKEIASLHKISGWIKNTYDDKVEALITGKREDVEKFIAWCKRGPEKAHVENVIITNIELQMFEGFEVIR
ncbi:acylphosphatase [Ginsengibacter hankyongi]|uniref:acylphosphatase n=1 Tax=Ginsengibacter hankyongi TaxID=2607284 RepID=A0A5J5IHR3_9BACT|nr:acylphosphatase [Ginsengibacter hankyongi]KAA9039118.1 acylphosphatase [Ginsengibacter hankyongi]